MMKNFSNYIYLMAFLLTLIIPATTMNTEEGYKSTIDNRTLKSMMPFEMQNFRENLEEYIQDRIGFRDAMVQGYGIINDVFLGELSHPLYTYGKDGFMFTQSHLNKIEYNDFHRLFAATIKKIEQYCEQRGTKFYMIFNPKKTTVYSRYLPEGVNYDASWVDSLCQHLEELGVNYINNTKLLTDLSYKEDVFNKQSDAGHWNDIGQFYATNALLDYISKDFPKVRPLSKDMYEISYSNAHYLPVSNFVVDEKVTCFKLKSEYEKNSSWGENELVISKSYPHFHYYINKADSTKSLPKALVFQGSYFNRNCEMLLPSFSEVIGIHNYQNVLNIDYYLNIFKPEIVIFDIAEYTVTHDYFNTEKMKDLDLSPAYSSLNNVESTNDTLEIVSNIGKDIDVISTTITTEKAKYIYLTNRENSAFEFHKNHENFDLSVKHNTLLVDNQCAIVIIDLKGNAKSYNIKSKKIQSLLNKDSLTLSQGVILNDDKYVYTTNTKGNRFDFIAIQLFDSSKIYIKDIDDFGSIGLHKKKYTHNLESGVYYIRLKADSNLKDEYIQLGIELQKNRNYEFSFIINSLSEKEINISNVKILGL